MNIKCYPSVLSGEVAAIPSKSDAHRKLICAALSDDGGVLPLRAPFCDDIAATIRCLQALGSDIVEAADGLRISPIQRRAHADLDCGESGSTLRFLLPVAMAVCSDISVTGTGRLPERPIGTLVDAMSAHGVQFERTLLPLHARGNLSGGLYEIPGNVSSQFLSGLLMALPLCGGDSEIRLTTPLQSSAYVDMTLDTLKLFGVEIRVDTVNSLRRYYIKGGEHLHFPSNVTIDGDWSNAAFWLTAGAIQTATSSVITVSGLDIASTQGDSRIREILSESGANVSAELNKVSSLSGHIAAHTIEMDGIPDLLPILAVRAAFANGTSHFVNAERLRLKESDRLASVAAMLSSLGGQVKEHPDSLTVFGIVLRGGIVDAQNDHRLVMAAAIAAIRCTEPVTIIGAEAVNKSYPNFFMDYIALGGKAEKC